MKADSFHSGKILIDIFDLFMVIQISHGDCLYYEIFTIYTYHFKISQLDKMPKDNCWMFVLGASCLAYLSLSSIQELYHVIKTISIVVVFHPSHGEFMENAHLHLFLPTPANRGHAKVQILLRLLDSVLRDHIVCRFKWNEHLKLVNCLIDLDQIESIMAAIFGYEGYETNARELTESYDKVTTLMVQRIGTITVPLDLNCLAFVNESILQRIHTNSGNVAKDHFGKKEEKDDESTSFPINEGTE